MLDGVERFENGVGDGCDIEHLIAFGETISETALCGLCQTAPNPGLSTIRHFRHEYEAHIKDKYCEAGVCATMFKSPCSNACPASVNIPGFVSLVGEQRYDEALKMHRERNPLASICARVCFHPCESKCMRSSLDGALAIRHVKRFMVEQEKEPQLPEIRESAENAARKVAVIGSGPAGLSAAYFLCRLGYKPVVFEAEPKAGGMLVQAIPAYRLPRQELEREVKMIESMGAAFEYGKALGRDFTLQDLRDEGYEAVFVAVGAPQGTGIGVPGEDGPGVYDGLSFLKEYNIHEKGEVGKNVAVIGGGNAAIDAARTALRLGAESVKILYRRTRAQMPAWGEEVNAADLEGIDILTLVAPEEILRDADGNVTGVRCREMVLGDYDRSGRRRPVAGRNPDFVVEADTVIAAIGQKLDAPAILDGTPVELNRWGYLAADPNTGQTSVDWVFTGGDAATGPSSVVEAIGAGEKAAAAIDQFLTGANHAFWRRDIEPPTFFDPDADPKPVDRHQVEELAVGARVTNFDEVELSWAAEVALAEARRCLRCDYGKYCS